MASERTGSTIERDGKIYARITYIVSDGKRHAVWQRAENRTHARELRRKILLELEEYGERLIDGSHLTFADLVAEYKKLHVFPAEYVGDQRIGGLRSFKPAKSFLSTLVAYFGPRRIKEITYSDIRKYKRVRLKTPIVINQRDRETGELVRRERPRSITSVHRELEQLRAALNFAKRDEWIVRNPFEMGEPLITKSDETNRDRILDDDEESRLLAQCVDQREHLRAIIIYAVDGGMRRGELLQIRKRDLDFANEVITILPAGGNRGLHFHDLRATFRTRALEAGRSRDLVQKTTGHTSDAIDIYISVNKRIARETAEALAARNQAKQK
jgi:integrase